MSASTQKNGIAKSRRTVVTVAGIAVCTALLAGVTALLAESSRAHQGLVFRHALDDMPLDVTLVPNEPATEAVTRFHATGENLYIGKSDAIVEGKTHYETWCQSCHLPDGSGWMGPSLIDDRYNYDRTSTDVGLFEIIFAGGAGAMQPFGPRLTQDEILKVIAYIRSLKPNVFSLGY